MTQQHSTLPYFPHVIQISARHWRLLDLGSLSRLISERGIPPIIFYRQLALELNRRHPSGAAPVHAAHLNLFATLQKVLRYLIDVVAEEESPGVLLDAFKRSGVDPGSLAQAAGSFVNLFPPQEVLSGAIDPDGWLSRGKLAVERERAVLRELLLLKLAAGNRAIDSFREILDDSDLVAAGTAYPTLVDGLTGALNSGPLLRKLDLTLIEALWAPIKASPDSLSGQLDFIRSRWQVLLPAEMLEELTGAFDILLEEERERSWGGPPGPPPVLEFGWRRAMGGPAADGSSVFGGYDYPEYELFSADADWMSNVVLLAKMVYVWLGQLSLQHGYQIMRLDQIPDAELERLRAAGFTGLWLIGIWERSPASQRIKQLCGNPEAIASAYSLFDYEIAADLGGWEALGNLRERAASRGIRLASDMVPNHTGIYSRWVIQHPDWFIQTDYPPFPTYQFNGEDLSHSPDIRIQIEDGYWTKTDAAVVFRYVERNTGRTRYIYHGNDGTSIPWNDTAQLDYLIPEVREAAIQTILHVARNFPIIRFDAAMTLAKKHFQRLWFPIRGLGGGIPSRAEHGMTREEFDTVFPVEFWREVVDRVAVEAPGTLLLAEAFWMMEGYFVRTLGMHRVYNSAFMNMLKMEENAKYRQTLRNVLEFNHEVLKRFVNFMNNPDEKTAVEQFGTQGKYFGACILMITMPGLPMFGHGQIEGLHEKYGMEYKRAYWDEPVDEGLLRGHEMWIFPLLRRRWLFSGSQNFVLYDFLAGSDLDENVFAYSNRVGDQRALVLFHNRYDTTAGWIKQSVPFAVKGTGGEPDLRRTTLAEALGVTAGPDIYYSFRDATSGLEYLRQSRELEEKGLYAELGEYEFFVFVDFHEIQDDQDGTWGSLCAGLAGRGVGSLEVERLQIRYDSLNSAFRAVLEQVPPVSISPLADLAEAGEHLLHTIQRFLSILTAQSGGTAAGIMEKINRLSQMIAFLASLPALSPKVPEARSWHETICLLLDTTTGARLLLTRLLLDDARTNTLERFGLDYSFQQLVLERLPKDSKAANESVQLLRALLECGETGRSSCGVILESAFRTPVCREYLMVHESEGVAWFNKERFEQFIQWLFIINMVDRAVDRPTARTISARLGAAGREVRRLVDLATHVGYRSTLFLQLVAPVKVKEKSAAAGAPKLPGPTRKEKQRKGSIRTKKAKTADDEIPD